MKTPIHKIFIIIFFCCTFFIIHIVSQEIFYDYDQRCKQLPEDITYIGIDYKVLFDEEGNVQNLKILEFQDGPTAGFRAYDNLFYKGAIWQKFWNIVATFNSPIWYVGPKPINTLPGVFSHNDKERIAFNHFLSLDGHYAKNLEDLENNNIFKQLSKRSSIINQNDKVIVLHKVTPPHMSLIENFKKKFPHVLFINQYSRYHTSNKQAEDNLFDDTIKKFRPKTYVGKKLYHKNLAAEIQSIITSEFLVIKPVNSSRSNGVIMIHKNDLDTTLKKILPKDARICFPGSYRPPKPLAMQYWKHDQNAHFMVEEYAQSNSMSIKGKEYDPTSRMVFALTNDKEKLTLHFLAGFWKIPKLPLDTCCPLTSKHISTYTEKFAHLKKEEIAMNEEQKNAILQTFVPIVFQIYKKILTQH
jgi:hypothetical protein